MNTFANGDTYVGEVHCGIGMLTIEEGVLLFLKKSSIKCFQRWRANEQQTKAEKIFFPSSVGERHEARGRGTDLGYWKVLTKILAFF